jgi:Predicted periplasmic lipoprotein (DUF2279)
LTSNSSFIKNLFLIFLLAFQILQAQDSVSANTKGTGTFLSRKNISIITLSGVYVTTLLASYSMWWRDGNRSFAFYKSSEGQAWLNDSYTRGIDKVGHFYTSYFFYKLSKSLLEWGGYTQSNSKEVAAVLSLGLGVIVEVGDGFSKYGFDYQDLVFNTMGLGYAYLQDVLPVLDNFNFKWSYIPTQNFHFPPNLTSTYYAHIYWLTADVHNLLGNSPINIWPDFLQIGIGFSISENLDREYILGFDFNLNKIFSTKNKDWDLLINTANMLHFPAPGIKYSKDKKPEYKLFILN